MDISVTSADGTRLAVRRTGSGSPVLAVHGSSGGLATWDPVADHLDGIELWTYARRGYAPSDVPPRANTYGSDVEDLLAVVDHVRMRTGTLPAVLAGSHGANIALHAARAHPDVIVRLALFEPALYAAGPCLVPVLAEFTALLDEGRLGPAARLFAERVAQMPVELLDELDVGVEPSGDVRDEESRALIGCRGDLEAMADDDGDLSRWREVTAPTMVVQGELTWSPMPETLDELIDVLPAPRRVVLAGQMHFATHTAPDAVAAAVGPFLLDRT